ncbi:MAG: biosynthetic peptidoglycan transglycosylase [Bacteroidales bacterium]
MLRSKITKHVLFTFCIALCSFLLLLSIFRGVIIRAVFVHEAEKIGKRHSLVIVSQNVSIQGLKTLQFTNLSVLTQKSDTVISVDSLAVTLGFSSLLALKVNPLEVTLSNASVNLQNALNLVNPTTGKVKEHSTADSHSHKSAGRLNRLIRGFFGISTAHFNASNVRIYSTDSVLREALLIPEWRNTNDCFSARVQIADENGNHSVTISGTASKKQNLVKMAVTGIQGKAKIPFTGTFLGIGILFDSANIEIQAKELSNGNINIGVKSSGKNLQLQGKRLSESTVMLDSAAIRLNIRITPHAYTIDTSSAVKLNNLAASIGISYTPAPDSSISLRLKTDKTSWQNLIESLPKGLFHNLHGIKVNGELTYNLTVNLSLNTPDSIKIDTRLNSKNFSILSYGNTTFSALNDTFTHNVYRDGLLVKAIHLGNQNNSFTPIDKISPFIRWAVITSEDGSFYSHRGFDLDGIRYAMACNIREKRFARGGSTIPQQLVKNLYLDQSKNVTRKLEEILIVWMIENSGVVSKDRMLEIYLNIIEWGPSIYGVTDACRYYFDKKPNEVTLSEALFLAYIIPRPTKFKYLFADSGHLKPFMFENFDFVAQKMFNRGSITESDLVTIDSNREFTLSGDALSIIGEDTTATGSPDIGGFIN